MFSKKMTDEEIVARGKPSFRNTFSSVSPAMGAAMTVTALLFIPCVAGGAVLGMGIGLMAGGVSGLLAGLLIGAGFGAAPTAIIVGKAMLNEVGDRIDNKIKGAQTARRVRAYDAASARLEEKYKGNPEAFEKALADAFNKQRAGKRGALQRVSMGRHFRF